MRQGQSVTSQMAGSYRKSKGLGRGKTAAVGAIKWEQVILVRVGGPSAMRGLVADRDIGSEFGIGLKTDASHRRSFARRLGSLHALQTGTKPRVYDALLGEFRAGRVRQTIGFARRDQSQVLRVHSHRQDRFRVEPIPSSLLLIWRAEQPVDPSHAKADMEIAIVVVEMVPHVAVRDALADPAFGHIDILVNNAGMTTRVLAR